MSSPATATPATQRKPQFERTEICAAAFRLFLQQGYEATTAEEIARTSGISRRTFFRYFDTKEDVVVAALAESEQRLLRIIRSLPETGSAISTMHAALQEFVEYYETHAPNAREAHLLIHSNEKLKGRYLASRDRLRDEIAVELALRSVPDPEARLAAAVSLAVLTVALDRWRKEPGINVTDAVDAGFKELQVVCGATI